MISVSLRFYEELNDFLPLQRRKIRFQKQLKYTASVKDLIESCGVPHTEVDLILLNGNPVDFHYLISNGDDISVFPVFESFDISGFTRLQKRPLRRLRFVADVNLGKLVRNMRMLGFDVAFNKAASKDYLIQTMMDENRVILTTDRRLLMQKIVNRGYCVHSNDPNIQALEVIRRFDLSNNINPFARCTSCNAVLKTVSKIELLPFLKPKTKQFYSAFKRCPQCHKIYWHGSHIKRFRIFLDWLGRKLNAKPN